MKGNHVTYGKREGGGVRRRCACAGPSPAGGSRGCRSALSPGVSTQKKGWGRPKRLPHPPPRPLPRVVSVRAGRTARPGPHQAQAAKRAAVEA